MSLMSAIGWESVDLEFIAKSGKSLPRFLEHLQTISFRYAQASLKRVGDYYVVCRAEPIRPMTSSPQEHTRFGLQSPLERSNSEADIFAQMGMGPASPGQNRRCGVCGLSRTTSHSTPLLPTSQAPPNSECLSVMRLF